MKRRKNIRLLHEEAKASSTLQNKQVPRAAGSKTSDGRTSIGIRTQTL